MDRNLIGGKVGDKVIVEQYQYGSYFRKVDTIKEITKTGNFKIGNSIYYPDGRLRGDSGYSRWTAYLASEEDIEVLRKNAIVKKVIDRLRGVQSLTYEQSLEIAKILGWIE